MPETRQAFPSLTACFSRPRFQFAVVLGNGPGAQHDRLQMHGAFIIETSRVPISNSFVVPTALGALYSDKTLASR
jgi:hypothetical protein